MRRKDKDKIAQNIILTCIAFGASALLISYSIYRNDYFGLAASLLAYGMSGILALLTVAQIFATYIRNQKKKQKKKDKIITNESK